MKEGTQQGFLQLGESAKALNDQGHPIDDITFITFIVGALQPPHLLLHLSLISMMAVKVTLFIITHQL